ncbi:DUF2407 C-terminal domain-containing protein [Gymnopilus junonius]|uniref:DUF2407 C-terminal domain-containing protein n=1 Tax=Gymnopilus junonius TaxID=109634 RepID=A0A9P5TLV2_GYMJU|nr:DUF2407 C-terminal domain-containing protein [Gymnopilus junonius]
MLSERAKGKQRAIEPIIDDDDQASSSSGIHPSGQRDSTDPKPASRDLVVRFTEGVPDLTVSVRKEDSVKEFKRRIRERRPELHNRRLRLIHSGRLLTDGTFLYSWLTSLEERQRRATSENLELKAEDASLARGAAGKEADSTATWIHCSIGPVMSPDEIEDDSKAQTAQIQPLRGFDRLTSIGFSPEDIENFRRQFHNQSSSNYIDVDFATEEEYEEHARALEEQWIDSIDNAGSATLSQSGSSNSTSFLQGVLMGFFLPPHSFLLSLCALRNQLRKMSMGLVVGFLVNILFGLWRFLLDTS